MHSPSRTIIWINGALYPTFVALYIVKAKTETSKASKMAHAEDKTAHTNRLA